MNPSNGLSQFARQSYLNLETFRKNGAGVQTPVWFVEDNGKFYVRTVADSAKVKRLRRSARVRVAPCQADGRPKGEWVEAEARAADAPALARQVDGQMRRKYGLMHWLFSLQGRLKRTVMTTVEITLR